MKLSVMMITYNHEQFIAQAIESVLTQRVNFDYEIVIGEDCSTDGTRAIVMDFHRRYPNRIVPLLRNQNLGVMQNLESTLMACRGQYLALLEGDDYWICDEKLQKQIDFLDSKPDCAICCHHVDFLNETGSAYFVPRFPGGSYTIEDLLKGNFIMTCSTVLRRDLVCELPGWLREMKLGDWPMFVIAARHGTIELMSEVMAVYRVHQGGTWSSLPKITRLRESVRMLKALDRHLEFQYTGIISRLLADSYFELACYARKDNNRAETGRNVFSLLRYGGWRHAASRRTLAGLAAYTLMGSWSKVFSMARHPKA